MQWDGMHDYDAHCAIGDGSYGYHIYYANKRPPGIGGGNLDVDIISPKPGVPSVENITFPVRASMPNGTYKLYVQCFSYHGSVHGFSAEVEFDGKIHYFTYDGIISSKQDVHVAKVIVSSNEIKIVPVLPMNTDAPKKEAWGLNVNSWHPVNIITKSPNYWGDHQISQLHHMFVIDGCRSTETPSGFYIEHLQEDLREYRATLQSLAASMPVAPAAGEEVSGLGFSFDTEFMLKVDGSQYIVKV